MSWACVSPGRELRRSDRQIHAFVEASVVAPSKAACRTDRRASGGPDTARGVGILKDSVEDDGTQADHLAQ
jgi:hypothetical protein